MWAVDNYPGIGREATAVEVRVWDIDVRADFKGLPEGAGSVARGRELYGALCAACHGSAGESNTFFVPLVGGTTTDDIRSGFVRALADPANTQRTMFMRLPTLSTLFDYIYRAMPWDAPKSLKPNDLYAVVAFLLNLAEIVPEDFTLSHRNVADVQKLLPNRHGMTTDHGLWPGAAAPEGGIGNGGIPDLRAEPCMQNCRVARDN
ncbi:MAG: c-type cytochrome [Pseudomonadales bacterium]